MAENFLRRWSRRKTESVAARTPEEPPSVPAAQAAAGPDTAPAPALPTMRDVQLLRADADFSPFMAGGVDRQVRRAALKTLFSDPHFQVMDGLDIYIDDYTRPSPVPPEMLAALWHAKSTLHPQPLYRPTPEEMRARQAAGEAPPADTADAADGPPDGPQEHEPPADAAEARSGPGDDPAAEEHKAGPGE